MAAAPVLSRKAHQAVVRQAGPRMVVAETVSDYRALIPSVVPPGASCIEIGCCNGVSTAAIAASGLAGQLLGIDHDELQLALARERWPELNFRCCDALDMSALRKLLLAEGFGRREGQSSGTAFADDIVLFVDINGSRELKTLIPILNSYATCFKPTTIVVKNWRLAHLVGTTELSSAVLTATACASAGPAGAESNLQNSKPEELLQTSAANLDSSCMTEAKVATSTEVTSCSVVEDQRVAIGLGIVIGVVLGVAATHVKKWSRY